MDWRRPDIGEMGEIALVVLVLLAGVAMLAGMPSVAGGRDRERPDWACVSPAVDDPACARQARAPVVEGRAVRKDFAR